MTGSPFEKRCNTLALLDLVGRRYVGSVEPPRHLHGSGVRVSVQRIADPLVGGLGEEVQSEELIYLLSSAPQSGCGTDRFGSGLL